MQLAESAPVPMTVFVPREVKAQEYRVALTPAGCQELVQVGCPVLVEQGAGVGSGYTDADYLRAGGCLVEGAREGFEAAQLVLKVKEPQPAEYTLLRPGQVLFTYLHLASSRTLTEALLACGGTALAYETLTDHAGRLPLLTPMSEVAGRMSIQEGARHLLRTNGGRGVLLGGVPGTAPGVVCVIGAGVVGTEAARMAAGLGAQVVLLDRDIDRLRYLAGILPANVTLLFSDHATLLEQLARADLVVGAVLLRGGRAPQLIARTDLQRMKAGAVIVDVAIDQGGIAETSRSTTHEQPTFVVDSVIHYGVPNIPAAVARTSTQALCNATLPYIQVLASCGMSAALTRDVRLCSAVNIHAGCLTEPAVAETFGLPFTPLEEALRRGFAKENAAPGAEPS